MPAPWSGANVAAGAVCLRTKLAHGPQVVEPAGRNRYCTEKRNPGSVDVDHLTEKAELVVPEAGEATRGTLMVPVIGDGSEFVEE